MLKETNGIWTLGFYHVSHGVTLCNPAARATREAMRLCQCCVHLGVDFWAETANTNFSHDIKGSAQNCGLELLRHAEPALEREAHGGARKFWAGVRANFFLPSPDSSQTLNIHSQKAWDTQNLLTLSLTLYTGSCNFLERAGSYFLAGSALQ